VFTISADCVERHCIWEEEEGPCRTRCEEYESEPQCKALGLCLWVEGTGNVVPKCVIQVCGKVELIFIVVSFI
jgi:hypothetical protein